MEIFHIYMIHNIINNKVYIGKSKNPQKRWVKHIRIANSKRQVEKFPIHKAISKYGENSFVFTIFQQFNTEYDANLSEQYWIKYFNSKDKKCGYNLTDGGEGVSGRIISEDTRQKLRKKAIGRLHSKETIVNMSKENNHNTKLKIEDVKFIRNNHILYSFKYLGQKYNVSPRTIAKIVYNEIWYDENYSVPAKRKIWK